MPHTPTVMLDLDMLDLVTTVTPLVLTILARDLLTLMLKLNHGWLMLTTDMPDTHMLLMPELTELTHTLMVLVTTDTLLEALTSSARDPLKLKLNPKLGMVLTDMVLIHTLMVDTDTHTLMVDIMDTESRLVKSNNS